MKIDPYSNDCNKRLHYKCRMENCECKCHVERKLVKDLYDAQ